MQYGLSIIFNETVKSKITAKVKEGTKNGLENITATFAGQKVQKDGEDFEGANLDSVFGGIVLDLRNLKMLMLRSKVHQYLEELQIKL